MARIERPAAGRIAALAAIALFLAACNEPLDADQVDAGIRDAYPDVEVITTAELAGWLEEDDPPVLIDVRTEEEFEVSHLAGAVRAESAGEAEAVLGDAAWDTPIVVYCSVGVRSAGLAQDLQRAGYSRVRNLQGSVFRWANEGRPLVSDRGEVRVVHPYDDRWGQLLDRDLWSSD